MTDVPVARDVVYALRRQDLSLVVFGHLLVRRLGDNCRRVASMSTMAAWSRSAARRACGATDGAAVAGVVITGVVATDAAIGTAPVGVSANCGAIPGVAICALVTASAASEANVVSIALRMHGFIFKRSQSHGTSLLSTETSPGPA